MDNYKFTLLLILFIVWFLLTVLLALSIIGAIFLIIPQQNDTRIYKPISELRSSWMQIGIDIKNKLLNN